MFTVGFGNGICVRNVVGSYSDVVSVCVDRLHYRPMLMPFQLFGVG